MACIVIVPEYPIEEPLLKPRANGGPVTPLKSKTARDFAKFIKGVKHFESIFSMMGYLMAVLTIVGLSNAIQIYPEPVSILFLIQSFMSFVIFMEIYVAPRFDDFKLRLENDRAGQFWKFHWETFSKEF
jgi:hypothetical protein